MAYSMPRDQLCQSVYSKSFDFDFLGNRLSATPKFLVVLRVPARVLGNAMFSNVFQCFPYTLRGSQAMNKLTKVHSPNLSSLLKVAREREMSLQPMVFDGFPITMVFPCWLPGRLWRAWFRIRAGHWKCKDFQWFRRGSS